MNQRLIVEGNDGWAITQLCESNGLPMPAGFTDKTIKQFVKSAGGYEKVAVLLRAALVEAQVKNIGIVVDANNAGPAARWDTIRVLLRSIFSENTLNAAAPSPEGIVLREAGKPVVGIWIMPDNQRNGYLEHFLTELVDQSAPLWQHSENTVADLSRRDFCRFKAIRRQKALIHTWLAWQEEPGRPFGIAMQAGYLNPRANVVQPFLEWMKQTFRLES